MDIHSNGFEVKLMEFWPVEHPVEPMEEDRPIECPKIPDTSAMNEENSYQEESYEKMRGKEKFLAVIDEKELVSDRKTPRRAIRKRPHNHTETGNDSTTTAAVAVAAAATFFKISPLCPFPPSDNNHKVG